MVDIYNKAAIAAIARLQDSKSTTVVLTSSHTAVSCLETGTRLTDAFSSLEKSAHFADLSQKNFTSLEDAKAAVTAISEGHNITVIAVGCVRESESAMLLAAAAQNAVLVERRRMSRTDQIDEAVSTLQSLNVNALGFILI